ncbi:MAG: Zn-binding domain-containing protein, partial [Candidatus Promineifilaceae bacterium]
RAEETDFYPYRYLASEGFLPGYNFPSLPVRAYIARSARKGEFIGRPRFLALSEFGPYNVIYHDGAKYQVHQAMLPVEEPEKRFTRAKLCRQCGYLHEGDTAHLEICTSCGAKLDSANGRYLESLLAMPTAATIRRERITSDEEERMRRGFDISTHYRFAQAHNQPLRFRAQTIDSKGEPLLRLTYAPSADLWRINHRWRRQVEDTGYRLDMRQGRWLRMGQEAGPGGGADDVRSNVRLYVRDTANALLVYPPAELAADDSFIASLQYALSQGIQETYQVEESELASERIGEEAFSAVLFWEAAEGGLGVLRHLVQTPGALAQAAQAAIAICHYDQDGRDLRPAADEENGCARACYECLLSYYNQRDHLRLNRHVIIDFLRQLAQGATLLGGRERDYEAHYRALRDKTDPLSELERRFLDHLFDNDLRLPDAAQPYLQDVFVAPDFFYEPNSCIFVDGSVHDEPQQQADDRRRRQELKDAGYRVIVYRYDGDLDTLVHDYTDVFGP